VRDIKTGTDELDRRRHQLRWSSSKDFLRRDLVEDGEAEVRGLLCHRLTLIVMSPSNAINDIQI
jgi:hypothetical protein